jgi:hypothetical protein
MSDRIGLDESAALSLYGIQRGLECKARHAFSTVLPVDDEARHPP